MGSAPLCCERDKIYAIEGRNEYRRLTVINSIGARRLLADDSGGEPEATSGTARPSMTPTVAVFISPPGHIVYSLQSTRVMLTTCSMVPKPRSSGSVIFKMYGPMVCPNKSGCRPQ